MPAQHRFYLPPRPRFIWTLFYTTKTSPCSLGETSIYASGRDQYLRRLMSPVFIPLGGTSIYAAWRGQYLYRLAGPVFIPLGTDKALPPWGRAGMGAANNQRSDKTYRLADPVFTSLGKVLSYEAGTIKNPSLYGRGVEAIASAANPVITPLGDASIYGIPGIGAGWAFCIRSLVQ